MKASETSRKTVCSHYTNTDLKKISEMGDPTKVNILQGNSLKRVSSILKKYHPEVKVPKILSEKSKEEQITRCADRLGSSPRAVDTLYMSLKCLKENPNNDKYRTINKSSAGYQRTLANIPGAEDMFLAMNFEPCGSNVLTLKVENYKPTLFDLGISALNMTRKTKKYVDAKIKLKFSREVQEAVFNENYKKEEAIRRSQYMRKVPAEPSYGRSALIQIVIAKAILKRRFDGDDTFEDVMNWLGGRGSVIPEKIHCREWSIMDLNRYPLTPIDYEMHRYHTLQHIGCWPSGLLEIIPSTEAWCENRGHVDEKLGPSRGLGCADL